MDTYQNPPQTPPSIIDSLLFGTVIQLAQGFYSNPAALGGKKMPVDQIVSDAKRLIEATGAMIAADAFGDYQEEEEEAKPEISEPEPVPAIR